MSLDYDDLVKLLHEADGYLSLIGHRYLSGLVKQDGPAAGQRLAEELINTSGRCRTMVGVVECQREAEESFAAAERAGDDSHLLTIGSPSRGLALRVTLGRITRRGEMRAHQPSAFFIWRGRRVGP